MQLVSSRGGPCYITISELCFVLGFLYILLLFFFFSRLCVRKGIKYSCFTARSASDTVTQRSTPCKAEITGICELGPPGVEIPAIKTGPELQPHPILPHCYCGQLLGAEKSSHTDFSHGLVILSQENDCLLVTSVSWCQRRRIRATYWRENPWHCRTSTRRHCGHTELASNPSSFTTGWVTRKILYNLFEPQLLHA